MLKSFLLDMIPFVLALTMGLLLLLLLVRRRIVLPINAISASMSRFAMDSRIKPEPLNIPHRDEIGSIAASYEKMTEDISDYVNNIEALTKEQVENNVQLDVARRIQYGLVPQRMALKRHGFEVCAMTEPAKAVGGDFYDCFQRDENSVCIVIGDVSGKGIAAAILMAMIKTIIREKLMAGLTPAEALNQTNDEICAQNPENLFATAFVAVLNPSSRVLRYANAGHNHPILLKKEPEYLRPDPGIALGLFEGANLMDEELTLSPGEGIMLYTDGVTDAVNPQNAFFEPDRLLGTLTAVSGQMKTAEDAVLEISRAVYAFCDGSEPFDDMAVMVITREETGSGSGETPNE